MTDSFYRQEELIKLGFHEIGDNIQISRKASFYDTSRISIGNNVRIDDFALLSGNIILKNNIHISAGAFLFAGDAGIEMDDFSALSSRVAVYAISDDFSGESLVNSTIDEKYRNVTKAKVVIGKHVVVGTGSTVLPGTVIGEGCAIGAMSLVNKSTQPWSIYAGIPCRLIRKRSKKMLELEKEFLDSDFSD